MKIAISAAAASIALAALPHCVSAQQQRDDAVVVTATRFPERQLALPVGVRVISASDIESSAATNLPELLSKFGGLHIRNFTGSPDLQIDLRGFGITGDQNTLVLLDGVKLNTNDIASTPLSGIPLNAIERIEILPGGGAVLYGPGATGGTINILTKTPRPGEQLASAAVDAGTHGTGEVRGSAVTGGDRFALSAHASHLESNGYRANNQLRQDSLLGDLRYGDSANHLGFRFGGDWQRLRLPGVRNEIQYLTDRRGATTPNDYSFRNGERATLYGNYRIDNTEFAAELGHRGQEAAIFNAGAFPLYGESNYQSLTFSPRLRHLFEPFGIPSSLVAGVDFSDGDYKRRIAGNPATLTTPFATNTSSQRSTAGYVQFNAQFNTGTKLTAGWRSQRISDRLVSTSAFFPPPVTELSAMHKPRAGDVAIRQSLGSSFAVTGKIGTSFRVATVDDNGLTGTGLLLDPQTARHREVGVEYQARQVQLRANVYRINLDNEIYFSPLALAAGFPGANVNLSPTRREGVELLAGWQPNAALELNGSLNLQSAKFRSGIYGGTDVSGRDVPLVPRTLVVLRGAWRVSPQSTLAASWNYVGRQRYDNDQDNLFAGRMPAYDIFDLKFTYRVQQWRLAASVRNLFDKKYFSYGIVNTFACATPSCVYPEAERTFLVSAEHRFK